MAFRAPARRFERASRFEREELVGYIHGIEADGEIAHIVVHKRGAYVRFSGRLGNHQVAPSSSDGLDKWIDEARTVWGLEDLVGVMRGWSNTPEVGKKLELLNIKAAKKKKKLGSSPVQRRLGYADAS